MMGGLRINRQGQIPRSALYLGAVLVLAAAALFFLRRQPQEVDHTLGGSLFSTPVEAMEGILLTQGRGQYRLDRVGAEDDSYWTLSGAVTDYLDQNAVGNILQGLGQATGGRLLAGSQPEDRRYEFNGPSALRLTMFGADGQYEKLAIGTSNPVTGSYYGSGAGRTACFPVAPGLREVLAAIPQNLRLKYLLPLADRSAVNKLEIRRGHRQVEMRRWYDRWWLLVPEVEGADGESQLGSWYRDYSAHYDDRRMERDGRTWLLADDQAARLVIYESSAIPVKELLAPGDAGRLLTQLDLDPPWGQVIMTGPGINPDPSAAEADQLEITFAAPLEKNLVPALRRGNVMLTTEEAVTTIGQPLGHLLDARALDILPSHADSLVLQRQGSTLMKAHRDQQPIRPGQHRKQRPVDFWLVDQPTLEQTGMDQRAHHDRCRNMLANLERTATLRVLPPSQDATVLKAAERVRLVLFYPGYSEAEDGQGAVSGVGRGQVVVEMGFIDEAKLPVGSPSLAISEDGLEPVGLWRPDTGQLLQIPGYIITTARAWSHF